MRSGSKYKRRQSNRYPVLINVTCKYQDKQTHIQITDLSQDGIFLNTEDHFQIGSILEIRVTQPFTEVTLLFGAEVRHIQAGMGVGVRFCKNPQAIVAALEEIARLRVLVTADDAIYEDTVHNLLNKSETPDCNEGDRTEDLTSERSTPLAGVLITDSKRMSSVIAALKQSKIKCIVDPSIKLNTPRVEVLPNYATKKKESADPKSCPAHVEQNQDLVGYSPPLREIHRLIDMVADKNCSVLIAGETGTGKELVAKAIHNRGPRARSPFVGINCGAIPEHLLEDELFGHVKGAYTSAHTHRVGRLEHANNGTLFLDEIGTMNMDLQVKLLRFLQEREFQKLGSNTNIKVNVRVIAASNMRLMGLIKDNRFRADLYYRLHVFPINLAPLRKRREDIPVLAEHFVHRFCRMYGTPHKKIDPVGLDILGEYQWPGNVRELENVIESAVILAEDGPILELDHFSSILEQLEDKDPFAMDLDMPDDGIDYQNVVCDIERNLLLEGLRKFSGNRSKAASYLDLKRTTFLEKMKRFKLNEEKSYAPMEK